MSRTFLVTRRLAAVPLVLVLAHCQPKSLEDQVAALPELPTEIAATLDPDTLATKVVSGIGPPETTTGEVLEPCCSSTETRRLEVRFRYIKCSSLDHVVDLGQLVLSQERRGTAKLETYKLTELQGRTIPLALCRVSNGPWNAILTEQRGCNSKTVRNLFIAAFDDTVLFTWVGTQSPPANVAVVACRTESVVGSPCGLKGCDCPSTVCPAGDPCSCPLQLPAG